MRDQPLNISLLIRHDEKGEFSLGKNLACDDDDLRNCHSLDITIGPSKTRDVFISFKSCSDIGESTAQLVIKPHLRMEGTKKSLKSTVQLHALACEPLKLTVLVNDSPLDSIEDGHMVTYDKAVRIYVKNEGQTPAFFKSSLSDIRHQFVLTKGQERRFKLQLPQSLGTLTLFHGPEAVRQVFKSSLKGANNSFLLGEDFKCYFDGEKPLKISGDVEHFFNNIQRNVIKIEVLNETSFVPLNVEEDCSSSAVMTNQSDGQSYEKKRRKRTISLDSETVHFPTVKVRNGTSVAKVTIKNRTDKPAFFTLVSQLCEPFENYHRDVEVKPFYYLSIPIRFRPTMDNQMCKSPFVLKNVQTGQLLTATLVGASQFLS